MKRHAKRGSAIIEFALSLLVLMPLFLGTGAVGINMVRTLETVQLARDAGRCRFWETAIGGNGPRPSILWRSSLSIRWPGGTGQCSTGGNE
jgi:hypothetical protein